MFRGIKPEDIGELIRSVHHQVKRYEKGEVVALSGEEYNRLHIIVEGAVIGEISDFEGKTIRIEELHAPDTIAPAFIFGTDNHLPVNVTSLGETRIIIIQREDLLKLLRKDQNFLLNYLNSMASRAQLLSKKIRILTLHSIHAKLANYLLEEMKWRNSEAFVLRHTHQDLSEMFGVARPSVSRIIRELHGKKIIIARGKRIHITDKRALSALLR